VDERELIRRAQKGDKFAFEQLVQGHAPRLYTLAVRMLGSRADADDALQETLIRAWTALPRFRGQAQLSTWLYRIALNAIHDQQSRTRPTAELIDDWADRVDRFEQGLLGDALQRALAALADENREAIVLYDVLGASYAEIAELQGVAEGTVKSRIFRGRRELAALLEGQTE
jgi:RNA polymerase sigma-70 factor (ECF subfamily)